MNSDLAHAPGAPPARRGPLARAARRVLAAGALLLLLLVALASVPLVNGMRDPVPGFDARRGELESVEESGWEEARIDHERRTVRLRSTSGLEVDLAIKRPLGTRPDAPVIVVLGGHRTGSEAVDLIPDTRGMVIAALSYPFAGDHAVKGLAVLPQVPAIQRALADTPPAVFLATDYLLGPAGLEPARLELVGVSLGAIFAGVVGALDERFERVWFLHGAGDLQTAVELELVGHVDWLPARRAVARMAMLAARADHLSSEHWIGAVSPRPVVLVNGLDDERLPRVCIEALHAAARTPSEVIWLEGRHVSPSRTELVQELIDIVADGVRTPGSGSDPTGPKAHPDLDRR
jgi:hypothetical protein